MGPEYAEFLGAVELARSASQEGRWEVVCRWPLAGDRDRSIEVLFDADGTCLVGVVEDRSPHTPAYISREWVEAAGLEYLGLVTEKVSERDMYPLGIRTRFRF